MRFCSLLHGFLFKSHDLRCYVKPRRYSLFYISIKIKDYVISPYQVHLSKTTKHWDTFVSNCINSYSVKFFSLCFIIICIQESQTPESRHATLNNFNMNFKLEKHCHKINYIHPFIFPTKFQLHNLLSCPLLIFSFNLCNNSRLKSLIHHPSHGGLYLGKENG